MKIEISEIEQEMLDGFSKEIDYCKKKIKQASKANNWQMALNFKTRMQILDESVGIVMSKLKEIKRENNKNDKNSM
jgi:mevalonate kinase